MKFLRDETAAIRAFIIDRSKGLCEVCSHPGFEMDHVFGRRVQQTIRNCWWLCRECHYMKTNNKPSAIAWWKLFMGHCYRYDFDKEGDQAFARIDWLRAKGFTQ